MSEEINFGELKNDTKFTTSIANLDEKLNKIEEALVTAVEFKEFEELTIAEKVNLDNYLAYTANSLYWMYVKLNGNDTNEHGIKNELSRIRETIVREKQIKDLVKRPLVDKNAAGRFIKHGLHIRRDKDETMED